jgi:hypothetical protein
VDVSNLAGCAGDEFRLFSLTVKSFDDTRAMRVVPGQTTKGQSERSFFLYWFEGSRADLGILGGNDFGLWHRCTA